MSMVSASVARTRSLVSAPVDLVVSAAGDASAPSDQAHPGLLGGVARGGALNLAGAAVYGASNFVLLLVLTRELGVTAAGTVLVAIAIFNIVERTAEFGCSTGLIRWISRWRALGRTEQIRPTLVVALVPVMIGGLVGAGALLLLGPTLAHVFAGGDGGADVATVVRAMAPFLPLATVYSVVISGTRGFGTMLPQVAVEKFGRGGSLPVMAGLAAAVGASATGVGVVWAGTFVVALIPAVWWMARLLRSAEGAATGAAPTSPAASFRHGSIARDYWAYTAPRAAGQVSEVMISWIDTIVVGAMVSTAAAGVYAAGTRFLLPGLFVTEALMQVAAPVVSGLLAGHRTDEATQLVQVVASWSVVLLWPVYLLVLVFAPVLLRVFGPDVVAATGALRALSVAVLFAALIGPSHSVVLMAGRSRQAMFNTFVLLAVNLGANVWLVPTYGLTAAG
ncbi:MAG: MATE family efflux transporter, partial [Actinomycetes bacterium]